MNVHRNVSGRLMPARFNIPRARPRRNTVTIPDRILRKWIDDAAELISLRFFGYQFTEPEHVDFYLQRMTLVR